MIEQLALTHRRNICRKSAKKHQMVKGHTNWTTMFLQILLLICSVSNTYGAASNASPSCASDEYRVGQVCCFACPAGYRVRRDCTATTNSLCSKCPDGTFKEGLSGQKQCTACTKCDTGQKVKKLCTPTSDTECEILDGFFCSDSADKDTFSDATLLCQPHTMCDSVGGVQIKPGTDSTDSTCIKYVTIVFIIIGCISFIILLVLGALVYRRLKMERDLTGLDNLISEMETPDQVRACYRLYSRLEKKKKIPEQQRKFDGLFLRFLEKRDALDLDCQLTELEILIREKETTEQERECWGLYSRLDKKKKTPEQQRKFDGLFLRFLEKRDTLELDCELTGLANQIREMETPDQGRACYKMRWLLQSRKKTPEQERKLTELIDQYYEKSKTPQLDQIMDMYVRLQEKTETPEQETKLQEFLDRFKEEMETLGRDWEIIYGAAGEGTSRLWSTPLLWPAGLETSSPPAPSSETQPAEETTPLMSRDPEDDVIRRDISASQSIPSTSQSACWSAAGGRDIEMGPVPGFLNIERVSLLKVNDITGDKVTQF